MKARLGVSVLALAAVAFAGGWHYGLFEIPTSRSTNAVPVASSASGVTSDAPAAKPVAQAPTPAQPNAPGAQITTTEASATPSFDVVRVEPDGAAVVAGRAAPNSTVSLQSGSERLAEAKTDATGAFALDLTLPVGQHRLALSGTAEPADPERAETAIVNVPQKGREGELLVMVERPGEASEIVVKPEAQGPAAKPQAPSAAAASSRTPPADAPQTAASDMTPTAGETKAPPAPLSVEAVEAEDGKLFIAGAARERAKVHVYLDDTFVAEAMGGAGDRFIASANAPVSVGDHVVRADELDAAGQVVARVEVPFNRPDTAPLAAIAPADAQPATAPAEGSAQEAEAPATTADAQAQIMQPALERVDARVIIRKGDTLWRISRNTYGRGSRFTVIYLANGDQIRNPNRIYPGQVFRVPEKDG
ncbi:LysM peptidoglycan-binding domain-containing protein [Aureimonas sp. N4]|uniref:LysM peptidoglycan-binding domain-containing protein n=1 Tax=Aureimonas sp. N4 TaxID=1638165 RepID=UPI0007833B32|nr:LysM peptidoglycan-binding domain-containing protein [Aureimonas sp. N4]